MERGIVVRADRADWHARASMAGVGLEVSQSWKMPWATTMFCYGSVPWDLAPFAFALAELWGLVSPFDRAGMLASEIGTAEDRAATEIVVGDLRQPVYSPDIVVVSQDGSDALRAWRSQCRGGDERLAFLRALHLSPTRIYAAPRAWLLTPQERARLVQ